MQTCPGTVTCDRDQRVEEPPCHACVRHQARRKSEEVAAWALLREPVHVRQVRTYIDLLRNQESSGWKGSACFETEDFRRPEDAGESCDEFYTPHSVPGLQNQDRLSFSFCEKAAQAPGTTGIHRHHSYTLHGELALIRCIDLGAQRLSLP